MSKESNIEKLQYTIIDGGIERADECREFCRRAYLAAYVRPEIGITEELFDEDVFSSPRIVKYYKDLCSTDANHRLWLAVDEANEILGMVAATRKADVCEMRAFYVRPDLKGRGIGHALYRELLLFSQPLSIEVDVVEYMQDTIDMYQNWGFRIDESKGKVIYPIIEWPERARLAYQAIYMVRPPR